MINEKPRFGLDQETGQLYDYLSARYHLIGGVINTPDGQWDTEQVATLLLQGKSCAIARVGDKVDEPADKVEQAKADFTEVIDTVTEPIVVREPSTVVVEDVSGDTDDNSDAH